MTKVKKANKKEKRECCDCEEMEYEYLVKEKNWKKLETDNEKNIKDKNQETASWLWKRNWELRTRTVSKLKH